MNAHSDDEQEGGSSDVRFGTCAVRRYDTIKAADGNVREVDGAVKAFDGAARVFDGISAPMPGTRYHQST